VKIGMAMLVTQSSELIPAEVDIDKLFFRLRRSRLARAGGDSVQGS
jgi:hypothetical protein